eukprot:754945-Hanusia_phi.AAC.2
MVELQPVRANPRRRAHGARPGAGSLNRAPAVPTAGSVQRAPRSSETVRGARPAAPGPQDAGHGVGVKLTCHDPT